MRRSPQLSNERISREKSGVVRVYSGVVETGGAVGVDRSGGVTRTAAGLVSVGIGVAYASKSVELSAFSASFVSSDVSETFVGAASGKSSGESFSGSTVG